MTQENPGITPEQWQDYGRRVEAAYASIPLFERTADRLEEARRQVPLPEAPQLGSECCEFHDSGGSRTQPCNSFGG